MNTTLIALLCMLSFCVVGARIHSSKASESDISWGKLNQKFDLGRFNNTTPQLASIKRSEVIRRAKEWVDKKIPYCQCNGPQECCGHCPYCSSFRCDCSGFVSYCWGLSYGYTTFTLPHVSREITKGELKPGDILLNVQDHVVIFAGWADSRNHTYHCFQEPGCHTSGPHYAFESVVEYPFSEDPSAFKPYRYDHIED